MNTTALGLDLLLNEPDPVVIVGDDAEVGVRSPLLSRLSFSSGHLGPDLGQQVESGVGRGPGADRVKVGRNWYRPEM